MTPRAILFGDPEKSSVRISPNGKLLGYQSPADVGGQKIMNIWVKTVDKDDARVITHAAKGELDGPIWQFDNEHILYLQDADGDENFHVFQTDLNTRVTRGMTPFLGARATMFDLESEFPNTLLVAMNV